MHYTDCKINNVYTKLLILLNDILTFDEKPLLKNQYVVMLLNIPKFRFYSTVCSQNGGEHISEVHPTL